MAGKHSYLHPAPRLFGALLATVALLVAVPSPAAAAPGDIDTSFSGDGRVLTDLDTGSDDEALAAAVDAQGRIVLAGYSSKWSGARLAVARYGPNGAVDPTFGGDGIVLDDHAGGIVARDVAVDSAGRIVVAGENARGEPAAIRLLDDGRIDPRFGRGGVAYIPFEADDHPIFDLNALTLDRFGRILLAGSSWEHRWKQDFGAVRLLEDGSVDRAFGGDGLITHSLWPNGPEAAADVLIDAFDRIVLAGGSWIPHGDRNVGRFALARVHDDGSLDPSLRGDGTALIRMNERGAFATSATLIGTGTVLLAGRAAPWTGFAKVWGNGTLAKGFGKNGRARLSTNGAQWAMDVEIDGEGRPVAAIGAPKASVKGAGPLVAARLKRNGRPDWSFSKDSRALARFGRWRAIATLLALEPGGGIVVAGSGRRPAANQSNFVATRFLGD